MGLRRMASGPFLLARNESPIFPPLPRAFYARPTLEVARALLGTHLVRMLPDGTPLVGRVVETEAYVGAEDSANHARFGRTPRTALMYGPPGYAYVYLTYGIHWMLNAVTDATDFPAAVLVRAVEPVAGQEAMARHRPVHRPRDLTNGPAKLTQAFAITGAFYGHDLTAGRDLWFAPGEPVPDSHIVRTPRIGIDFARPEHRDAPWRFTIKENRWVSR